MIRPALGAVAALLALAAPADALAGAATDGGGSFGILFSGPGRTLRQTQMPADIQGRVEIEYRGDAAAGCAFVGTCDTVGRIVWDPGRQGNFFIVDGQLGGRRYTQGLVFLGSGIGEAATVVATARRGFGGAATACADAQHPNSFPSFNPAGKGRLRADLTGSGLSELLKTRCGGPLQGDLAAQLPRPLVSVAALRRGGITIALASERAFATQGFSGTVRSTVSVRLGRPRVVNGNGSGTPPPPGILRPRSERTMTAEYRLERLTGAVSVGFRGHSDAARCGPLDACGLDGRLELTPRATSGSAYMSATGPATLPRSRFRAALGLEAGSGRGIRVYGGVEWSGPGGAVQTQTWQAGGFCGSAMPVRAGAMQVRVVHGRAIFDYTAGDFGTELPRARCPGPLPSEVGGLVSGSIALRALGGRRIVVRMRRGSSFSGEAHRGFTSGHVDIVLRRLALRESTYQTFAPN